MILIAVKVTKIFNEYKWAILLEITMYFSNCIVYYPKLFY